MYGIRAHKVGDTRAAVILRTFLLVLFLLTLLPTAALAAPVNDDWANATLISGTKYTGSVDTTSATSEPSESFYRSGTAQRTVWWKWTPNYSGNARFLTYGAAYDSVMTLNTGTSLATLTTVASNDDSASYGCCSSEINYSVTSGETYYIQVDGYSSSRYGVTPLFVNTFPPGFGPPVNDDWANATVISGTKYTGSVDTTSATSEPNEAFYHSSTAKQTVWWKWTPTYTGNARFLTYGVAYDSVMTLNTGTSLATLSRVVSNDDSASYGCCSSEINYSVSSGVTYYIQIDGYSSSAHGVTPLFVNTNPNDDFANALELNSYVPQITRFYNNLTSSHESGEPVHAGNAGEGSVWFKWTAPASQNMYIDTVEQSSSWKLPDLDTLLGVYTGSSVDTLTAISANDDFGADIKSRVQFAAVSGKTYYIAVDGKDAAIGEFQLRLGINNPPPNDDWANAAALTGTSISASVDLNWATSEVGEPNPGGNSSANPWTSVWYKWVAPANGTFVYDVHGTSSSVQTRTGVYTGTAVNALTWVNYGYNSGCDSYTTKYAVTVTAGTTYYLNVNGYSGTSAVTNALTLNGDLNPAAPSNDNFSDAFLMPTDTSTDCRQTWMATSEVGEPLHAGVAGGTSIWYKWVPTKSGLAAIRTNYYNSTNSYDTLLGIYQGGSLSTLTEIASNDNQTWYSPSNHGAVEVNVTAGLTYYIAVDGKGGTAGENQIQLNPSPPYVSPIYDGPTAGVDIDTTSVNTSLQADWNAILGYAVTSYDWCLSTSNNSYSTTCSSSLANGNTSGPLSVNVPGPFADNKYYFCVRSVSLFNPNLYYYCSDGIIVDTGVLAPTPVKDGPSVASDLQWQTATDQLQGAWGAVIDISGIDHYETCFSSSASCASGVLQTWTSQDTNTTATLDSLTLVTGTTYYVCARAIDNAGFTSTPTCSNGVLVVPARAVSSVAPNTEPQGRKDVDVQVLGSGFQSGAGVSFSGGGITVNSVTFVSDGRIDANISIAAAAATGQRDVTVTNPDTSTASGIDLFSVQAPTMTLAIDTIGFTDGTRNTAGPTWAIDFAGVMPGDTRSIGPVASGQAATDQPALNATYSSDTDAQLLVSSTNFSGPAALPLSNLKWAPHGLNTWTSMTNTNTVMSTVSPGSDVLAYDLQLAIPSVQPAGTYSANTTVTLLPTP